VLEQRAPFSFEFTMIASIEGNSLGLMEDVTLPRISPRPRPPRRLAARRQGVRPVREEFAVLQKAVARLRDNLMKASKEDA
jgi:hypothetical protein